MLAVKEGIADKFRNAFFFPAANRHKQNYI